MRTLIVIPARYASSRLPGKPLLRSTGKYLIQHVVERAAQATRAFDVVVATDDPRIVAAVESFGGTAIMTDRRHPSGMDRVAEVARKIDADAYVNLQGDEPSINPADVDELIELLDSAPDGAIATLAAPISTPADLADPNCVKIVCDAQGRALYFSRSPIPYVRDGGVDWSAKPANCLQHVGIYAYRRDDLLELTQLPPSRLEKLEKLEQLRALENGWSLSVGTIAQAHRGVDTFDDYQRFAGEYAAQRQRVARAA